MNIKFSSSHKRQEPESGVLYIVGTPIGNLNDISLRALNILENVSLIACEDTRQTKKLINRYELHNNLISFNKHNSNKKITRIINYLNEGKSVALVSDAGMPGICDPGEDLIRNAKNRELDVICIPGPSAILTALISSGMPSSDFIFIGFFPKKKTERERILEEIEKSEKTIVLFEAPHRLMRFLRELKEYCGGEREIQVFRELTKKYEEHVGTNLNMVIDHFSDKEIKGELTIVIKGINKSKDLTFDESELKKELYELINAGLSLLAASKYLAKKNKISKSTIYNLY